MTSDQTAPPRHPTDRGRQLRLCRKELRETLRDRRTIVTLVVMPLLLYPLLSMALNRFLLTAGTPGDEGYIIGVQTPQESRAVEAWLSDPRSRPPESVAEASGGGLAEFSLLVTEGPAAREALEANRVDVAAEVTFGASGQPRGLTLIAYRGDSASQTARRIVVERLQWLRLAVTREVAETVRPGFDPLPEVEVESIGETEQPSMLGTIVPLVLVLMTITGAVYPAIDLTAGERERGTMESLMASPVPRWSLLVGKYAAVVTVALLTAIANLLAMFITLWASGLLPLVTGDRSAFPWLELLQILGLLVLFSGFFAAVLLSLTSFAKSFKEAQSYLIPVMLLSLAPAMLSLMPGTTLAGPLAIAPLINIVLLARDVLSASVQPVGAVAAIISTAAYAAAALAIAARLFGSDAVNRTSDDSIGSLLHRPDRPRPVPSPQAAALMLALLVPAYFIVSNGLMRFLDANRETISVSHQLLLNAAALVAAFGLVPLLAAHFGRNVFRTTYRLRLPLPASLLGAVLVGGGAWALAHEAFLLAEAVGIGGLSEERIRQTLKTVEGWKQVSPVLLVGTLAVAPAVVEELCFRGYLFSALLKVLSPARTVLLTSVLFGLFHVLTGNALLIERLVPSTLLGLILGWIAWRTGSVFPGMVMHLVHNGLLELVARYHDQLGFLPSDLDRQAHLPASWLLTATGVAIVGAAMIAVTTRKGGQ